MSQVRVLCIDDTNRPKQIPSSKWIKKNEWYRVLGIYIHLNQNRIQGITLIEKPLDESCLPFTTFMLSRFGIHKDDLEKFIQLAKDCTDLREMNEDDMRKLEQLIEEEIEVLT